MSRSALKGIQAAAGNAGEAVYVDDVFSTTLYTGNFANQTVTNGLDLDGEGGLLWIKSRDNSGTEDDHQLYDSERPLDGGAMTVLESNSEDAATTGESTMYPGVVGGFTSTGFALGQAKRGNESNVPYVSWAFRKAPKFFDVVTFSHTNGSSTSVSHNLGCEIGLSVAKRTDDTSNWTAQHRSVTGANTGARLNSTIAFAGGNGASNFFENFTTTTVDVRSNQPTGTYVAYLFAHNDGDGGFGEDGDQDIIKCGSYTGNGSSDGPEIDLGFEPQWIFQKASDRSSNWYIYDAMRGIVDGGNDDALSPNTSAVEYNAERLALTSSGFKITTTNGNFNQSGENYIYVAIRRPNKPASEFAATDLFDIYQGDGTGPPGVQTPFPVDWGFYKNVTNSSAGWEVGTRLLQGKELAFNSTNAESDDSKFQFDFQDGWRTGSISSIFYAWNFRRAPGFFDVVAYEGTDSARTINHNLGVVPEMMWVKRRNGAWDWFVYHKDLDATNPSHKYLKLNDTAAVADWDGAWNDTDPTSSVFSVGEGSNPTNTSAGTYIAYLFASVDGISKVGSYTGNGSSQTIDCGFSTGARFVLTKRVNTTGNWNVWDSERGIVAGNDPRLELNTSGDEDTGHDYIDPDSSGFIVNYVADDDDDSNVNGDEYIFLAIA